MICFVICAEEFLQGNCLLSSQTLCYLTLSGTKLCLYSSSQSCFNLQSSPHILCVFSSPWEAPPSHPVNNHVNPGLDFPSLSFARPAALPFPLAPGLASSDCCVWSLCAQPRTRGAKQPLCSLEARHECGDSPLPVQQLWQGGQTALLPRRGRLRARHAPRR